MCGICGELRFKKGTTEANWPLILDLMDKRGPDSTGFWSDNAYCELGFKRLSILDLTDAGNQPMHPTDEQHSLVFNGEIYNFIELRQELEEVGYVFRSTGDTEVVLNALIHWGEGALSRFNGMFALAFYNREDKSLLLARDHVGIKPLYYMHTNKGVVFASQYNQILAHPWSKSLKVSHQALGEYFQHLYIPAPLAILENTFMLKPGSYVTIAQNDTLVNQPYYAINEVIAESYREEHKNLDRLLDEVVKDQIVSDVGVGTFLSGGIDSPLITSYVADLSPEKKISAFTIGTDDAIFDESEDASRYAKELDVDHHLKTISTDGALELIQDVTKAFSEPFSDFSVFPSLLVCKHASKQGYKVVLSGDGGDEGFLGYSRSIKVLKEAKYFKIPFVFRQLEGIARKWTGRTVPARSRFKSIGRWYQHRMTHFSIADLNTVFPTIGFSSDSKFDFRSTNKNEIGTWMKKLEYKHYLPEVLLKMDRASMFNSLEVRVPLLDKRVIEYAGNLSWAQCVDIKRYKGKLPLRKVLKRRLSYQTTAKKGFSIDMSNWLKGPLKSLFIQHFESRATLVGLPINGEKVMNMFSEHCNDRKDYRLELWSLLSLALWEEEHWLPYR